MHSELLQAQIQGLQERNAALEQELGQARREIDFLRHKLDALARRIFGKKSEQLDPAQLQLLLSGLAQMEAQPAPPPSTLAVAARPRRERTQSRRLLVPEDLEVVREVIEPQIIKDQPEQWKCISQEVRRQLDYEPGKF